MGVYMGRNFVPDYKYNTVYDIEYEILKKNGIKALIFDIDNTLASYDTISPDDKLKELFSKLFEMGFKLYFLSNNNKKRVSLFAESTDIPHRWRACKPLGFFIARAVKKLGVKKEEAALIGDQLFTDVLGANRFGVLSILVLPVSQENEDKFVAFKRHFEKMLEKREN